ncbi:ATP-dependent zinc metalloprotease FTSH 5, mitochondrial [Gracilariopsis chorda]|uniref:ATP-dependent zinc metalloprotease FTSH 5, mitochondrial n=1 Tax=Gracilariopsis chorda TaxID=448386 RepID=A0A2V3J6G3_9FLOR|nr:ATP-dependent zinc metalloprotease FTSH 5, mitochondrial [Gracilariopsis chorda]|eukprot:PXF49903.1 ATP-dependent zinc metalloprotease FTSH 5, mitochondrial [Gracilariopsis chorda]
MLVRMNQEGFFVEDSQAEGQGVNLITELHDEETFCLQERRTEELQQEQEAKEAIMVDGGLDLEALCIKESVITSPIGFSALRKDLIRCMEERRRSFRICATGVDFTHPVWMWTASFLAHSTAANAVLFAFAAVSGSVGVSGAAGLGAGTNRTFAVANALGGRAGALLANGANGGVMSGTAATPLPVALAKPSMPSHLWRTDRTLGVTFFVLGFLGMMVEERGMLRRMGINMDKAPEPGIGDATTFEDVKGYDEAKAELEEIVHCKSESRRPV